MRKTIRHLNRLTAAALTLALLFLVAPLAATAAPAENVKIESMSVRIMPEYDKDAVLAVLEPVLSSDTKLPAKAKFYISKKHTDITIGMACEVPEGQGHRCKVYDTADAGDFQELSYTAEVSRNLFMEYYYNPAKNAQDKQRNVVYEFKSPYPIKKLDVQVQQPKLGTDYKIEPASTNVSEDGEGAKWHSYSFTDVKPDQVLAFNAGYTSGGLTKPGGIEPPQPAGGNAEAAASNPLGGRLFLFLFVVLFVAGSLAIYWRSKMVAAEAPAARPTGKSKARGAKLTQSAGKVAKPRFCGNCGGEIGAGHRFCSECGSEVA